MESRGHCPFSLSDLTAEPASQSPTGRKLGKGRFWVDFLWVKPRGRAAQETRGGPGRS